jgi:hypothetical protein
MTKDIDENQQSRPLMKQGPELVMESLVTALIKSEKDVCAEISVGACDLKIDRSGQKVRIRVDGGMPDIPQPNDIESFLALVNFHSALRPIIVVDPDRNRLSTILDYGASFDRIYHDVFTANIRDEWYKLLSRITTARVSPMHFQLTTGKSFRKWMALTERSLPHAEFMAELSSLTDMIELSTSGAQVKQNPDDPAAKAHNPDHDKGDAADDRRLHSLSEGNEKTEVRDREAEALRATVPTLAVSDARQVADGYDGMLTPQLSRKTAASLLENVDARLLAFNGMAAGTTMLGRLELMKVLRSVGLIFDAEKKGLEWDDPTIISTYRRFDTLPVTFLVSVAIFKGTPPLLLEAKVELDAEDDVKKVGHSKLRFKLPPLVNVEKIAFKKLVEMLRENTNSLVVVGSVADY